MNLLNADDLGLYRYAKRGNIKGVNEKLELGADPNASIYRNQPMLVAIKHGHLNVVELLLEKGAYINIQNWQGETPLIYAAMSYRKSIVKFLISKGADTKLKTKWGAIAKDMIYRRDIREILNSLEGPLSLKHITLNLIEKEDIPKDGLPEVLFRR